MIEVLEWESIQTMHHDLFYVRLKEKEQIKKIAEQLNLHFIFKKGNELLCVGNHVIYWYK